jgi:SAM-dependent methyltransferase
MGPAKGKISVGFRRWLRKLVPDAVIRAYQRFVVARDRRRFAAMSLRETFEQIYDRGLWEVPGEKVQSGTGSGEAYAESYAALVRSLIERFEVRTVVDLGCGDFSVGSRIARDTIDYVGVDVAGRVIATNNERFGSKNVHFVTLDLTAQTPPLGDLALLRQVLQHLSNDEILTVLRRCSVYPAILVSEHVPVPGKWTPNKDKPHGPDTRVYDNSGVVLEAPPFSIPVEEVQVQSYSDDLGGVIRSVLIRGRDLGQLGA